MKISSLLEAYQTNLQKMIAKKRKSASAGKQQCEWFAGCKNPATGSTPHPVFPNGVSTCAKCHKFATGEERGVNEERSEEDRRKNDNFYRDSQRSGEDRRSAEPSADPYKLTTGTHHAFRGPKGTYVTLKTTEPRGVPMQVMSGIANQAYSSATHKTIGPFRASGIEDVYTLAGWTAWEARKKVGWERFKPAGVVFRFDESVPENTAVAAVRSILDAFKAREEKFAAKRVKHRAGAPERAKAAAASYRVGYQKDRQALYDKYGKSNVLSVTARQIGGDDGYQWNVLINNRPMVNGLTQSQVPHYKQQAYDMLLKKYGKR